MDTTIINGSLADQKAIGLIFMCIGTVSCILSLLFFKIIKYSLFKGLAVTLLLFGVCQFATGGLTIASFKTGFNSIKKNGLKETSAIKIQIQNTEQHIQFNEMLLYASILCFAAGIILYTLFYTSAQVFWKGAGLGLFIQSTLCIILLFVQHYNFKTYYNYLLQTL